MRILSLLSSSEIGGAEIHVEQIVRHLPAQHLVVVLADGPMVERYGFAGAEVELLPTPGKIPLQSVPEFERIVEQFDPDVIHTHQTKATLLAAMIRSRRHRIITIHGSHRQFSFSSSLPAAWYKWADMWSARGASFVVAVCEADRRELIASGFSAQSTVTVPNGVPDPGIAGSSALGDSAAGEILWAGRFSPEKSPETVLAVARMLSSHPKLARIRMIGDGPYKPILIANNIPKLFIQPPVESLREALASASIVLNTSVSEGASLVLLEALASGRAIVATTAGGNPEVVGNAGILVPLELSESDRAAHCASALKRLLEEPAFRMETGLRARTRYIERFRIEMMVEALLKLYRNADQG